MDKVLNIVNLTSIAGQIETYYANNFVFNPEETVESIKFEIRDGQINEKMIEVYLNLVVESAKKESKEATFKCNSVYSGVFEVTGFEDEEERKKLVQIHCATILYPLCRERVMSLISHTPFDAVIPPTIDFSKIYEDGKQRAESQTEEQK